MRREEKPANNAMHLMVDAMVGAAASPTGDRERWAARP